MVKTHENIIMRMIHIVVHDVVHDVVHNVVVDDVCHYDHDGGSAGVGEIEQLLWP